MTISRTTAAALAALALGGCGHYAHKPSASTTTPVGAAPVSDTKGECRGVNACKGQGACGGVGHECAGENACKGKGWLSLTVSECAQRNGTFNPS